MMAGRPLRRARTRRNGWGGDVDVDIKDAFVDTDELKHHLLRSGWDDGWLDVYEYGEVGENIRIVGHIKLSTSYFPGKHGKAEALREHVEAALEDAGGDPYTKFTVKFTEG